jgi:hypothetical protein
MKTSMLLTSMDRIVKLIVNAGIPGAKQERFVVLPLQSQGFQGWVFLCSSPNS